jgi:hypothetical protein
VLALRFVLEGDGPAGTGLPMRAAALRAEPEGRPAVKSTIERAMALERALVRGEAPQAAAAEDGSPLELVVRIESVTRAILRQAVSGALGTDPRAAAAEILLADGLAAGEGAASVRGTTAEWDALPEPHEEPDTREEPETDARTEADGEESEAEPQPSRREPPMLQQVELSESAAEELERRMPRPEPEAPPGEPEPEEGEVPGRSEATEAEENGEMANRNYPQATRVADGTWLDETDSSATLDWPERPAALRMLDRRPAERKATRDRVEHLFPRPETTEWSVGELDYDRRRRRVRV